MEIIFKFLGIAGLAIIGIVVLLIVIFLVVFMFLALQLELKKPERKVLLEMTFRGTQFRYEELSKARVGHTEHQFLLSMNGKYIWSVGSEIEPLFRGTKHFVVPVHPEDLQNVVAIRRLAVHLSSPLLSDSSFAEIQRYIISTMGGRAMWLSPKDLTLDEFELIGDFLESYYAEEFIHQRKPLFYQDVLVYADDFLFSERIYMRKVEKGEMSITISLDGEAYYRQDISGDRIFGQSCGNLDSTTKILYIQLAPADGLVQPLKLTKEEIESFVDASGNLLRARYTVEILPTEVSF